ncbi:hypothetical protein [Micromonospora ureilytica]|uniref:Core-binding (CB) domain-containing protein n=1 Tax=Micromonospora ureilytica TaxID=709868 RepID=A0ABS0J9M3_9ACTN|nr:hypothetical protein [Micromonospora ureilytica]MBG6063748.1 hypothetical protein [Micromonospora ureilytica]
MKVYAGIDPITKKRHYLTETTPDGPTARKEAEKVRTRFLAPVDNPRTRATVNQLLDRWLEVLDVETSTRQGYVKKLNKHVRPLVGQLSVGRLDAETLESFYAVLRKCRDHCGGGRKTIEHRKAAPHDCTDKCRPHACKPLAPASIRQIHWILCGALNRAVRWRWIAVNPADQAETPGMPQPSPHPPTAPEEARLWSPRRGRTPTGARSCGWP